MPDWPSKLPSHGPVPVSLYFFQLQPNHSNPGEEEYMPSLNLLVTFLPLHSWIDGLPYTQRMNHESWLIFHGPPHMSHVLCNRNPLCEQACLQEIMKHSSSFIALLSIFLCVFFYNHTQSNGKDPNNYSQATFWNIHMWDRKYRYSTNTETNGF